MRILMVNLTDWSGMSGGAQHQLGLFEAFCAAGHKVRMITTGDGDCPAMPYGVQEVATIVRSLKGLGLPANLDTLGQLPALIAQIVTFRPDLVYSRANTLTIAVAAVCRSLGTPVVLEHNSWLESQRRAAGGSKALAVFERLLQIGATRIATGSRCVTPGLADRLQVGGVSRDRLIALGNGTDCEHFHPIARREALRQFNLPRDRTYVGFIGNVMPWHGLETAVAGFADLSQRFAQTDLLIVGDGPGLEPLRDQARRLGVSDRVRTIGRVPFGDANAAINCFDLAILPLSMTHDIGFGFSAIKLRDYAAAGRIVLTGHVPGNIELAGEPWMLTHAPDDAGDFGAALEAWLKSHLHDSRHWEHARHEARNYALQQFAWPKIAADIIDFARNWVDEMPAGRETGQMRLTAAALRS